MKPVGRRSTTVIEINWNKAAESEDKDWVNEHVSVGWRLWFEKIESEHLQPTAQLI